METDENGSSVGDKIEFVSYSGKYPFLCMGRLILRINGKEIVFGDYNDCHHDRFWTSDGYVKFNPDYSDYTVYKDDWVFVRQNDTPDEILRNIEHVMKIFNENVPHGCCGGCA